MIVLYVPARKMLDGDSVTADGFAEA